MKHKLEGAKEKLCTKERDSLERPHEKAEIQHMTLR